MAQVTVKADILQVLNLGDNYRRAAEVGLRRLTERGEQLVRAEVPKVTHNLEQGVSSDVKVGRVMRGDIIVSARTGRKARRKATLHLPSGKTKEVTLRATPAYDYAEAVATGTGVYSTGGAFGPQQVIRPKKAKALLVPVTSVPTLNGRPVPYISDGSQLFIMRRFMKGRKPNLFDQRAAARLDNEVQPIFDRALGEFMGGKS